MASSSSNISAFSELPEDYISARIQHLNAPTKRRAKRQRLDGSGLFAVCVNDPQSINRNVDETIRAICRSPSNIARLLQIIPDLLGINVTIADVPLDDTWLNDVLEQNETPLSMAKKKCACNAKDAYTRYQLDVLDKILWRLTHQLVSQVERAPISERIFSELSAFLGQLCRSQYTVTVLVGYHIALDLCECMCLHRVQIATAASSTSIPSTKLLDHLLTSSGMDAHYTRVIKDAAFDNFLVRFAYAMNICIPAHDAHFGSEKNVRMLRTLLEIQQPRATEAVLDVCATLQKPGLCYILENCDSGRGLVAAAAACVLAEHPATAIKAMRIVTQWGSYDIDPLMERFCHFAVMNTSAAKDASAIVVSALSKYSADQQYRIILAYTAWLNNLSRTETLGAYIMIKFLPMIKALDGGSLVNAILHSPAMDDAQMALMAQLLWQRTKVTVSLACVEALLANIGDVAVTLRTNNVAIYWLFRTLSLVCKQEALQTREKLENAVDVALGLIHASRMQMALVWPAIVQFVVDVDRALRSQTLSMRIEAVLQRVVDVYRFSMTSWQQNGSERDARTAEWALMVIGEFLKRNVVGVGVVEYTEFFFSWRELGLTDKMIEGQIGCCGALMAIEAKLLFEAPSDGEERNVVRARAVQLWEELDGLFEAKPDLQRQICETMALYCAVYDKFHLTPALWRRWNSKRAVMEFIRNECFVKVEQIEAESDWMSFEVRQKLVLCAFRMFWRWPNEMAEFGRHFYATRRFYEEIYRLELKLYAGFTEFYSNFALEVLRNYSAENLAQVADMLMSFMEDEMRSEFCNRMKATLEPVFGEELVVSMIGSLLNNSTF